MSSGLGEWEKGIPCMLTGVGRRPGGGCHLGLLSAQRVLLPSGGTVQSEPSSSGSGGGTVTLVYSTHFNLGSQG